MKNITLKSGEVVAAEQYFRSSLPYPKGVVFDTGGTGEGESTAMVWNLEDQPIILREGDWVAEHPVNPERNRVFRDGVEIFE